MSSDEPRKQRSRGRQAERLDRQMDQARRKMDEARRRIDDAERKVERELGRAARDVERAAGPVWARPEPGTRRARFTREQIAEAALAIADAEGIDAVSMRRVASELGAGTMTLYHYVHTKDELLALMDDAIMAELLVPDDELATGWREALTQIARRSRDALLRHPWTTEGIEDVYIGPNALRHMEQSMAAVAELDIDFAAKFEIVELVDEYVFGHAIRGRAPGPQDPAAQAEWRERAFTFIDDRVATGEFPHMEAALPPGGTAALWAQFEARDADQLFERGLRRLLDGIQLELER